MRKSFFAASILTLSVAVAPGCATKKFVRGQVGDVNQKVDTLSGTLEETQERTRRNEERIGNVDQKAEAAGRSATDARTAANSASATANAASATANAATMAAKEAGSRADAVEAASRRLVYEVTLSEDQGNFKFAKTELPQEAKARIDQMIDQLKADPKAIYIEIEGHTDNVGSHQVNERIGLERAEAVKRYIYEQHQVPLHKMNVISYGEDKPVAPNKTKDGRAQNRRVVIRVLS
jgi:outer membrane protein OmpA-like peptidoglycan-associated protein